MDWLSQLRAIFGFVTVFFLPGFAWTLIFFGSRQISRMERLALAFGLSISIVTLSILALDRVAGIRITGVNSLLIIAAITLTPSGFYYVTKRHGFKNRSIDWRTLHWRSLYRTLYRITGHNSSLLLPVMILAFYFAFIPHMSYPYPVHLDEWVHLACSKEIVRQASAVNITWPLTGGSPVGIQQLEIGFHAFWAVFYEISGISWLTIFRYFPGITFMITALSVYVLGQRQGFGWEAAFLATLIPTTVGILGPAFLVPVAMGLLFVVLSLFLAFNFRTRRSYLVLTIFLVFLFFLHSATAIGLIIILIPHILLNIRHDFKHSFTLALVLAVSFLAALPLVFDILVLPSLGSLFSPQPFQTLVAIPLVIQTYGYFPATVALLGTFVLAVRGGINNYSLALGLLALLAMLALKYSLHYGIEMMYYRGLLYMMLMLSAVAGAGLMTLRNFKLPLGAGTKMSFLTRNTGNLLSLVVISLILVVAVPSRLKTPYYHMIDSQDYEAFIWIEENVGGNYQNAILDPWKGTAFTAISGKRVYSAIGEKPTDRDREAYAFLDNGCEDADFLKRNNIDIIYTPGQCRSPGFVEVRENVYLLNGGSQ